MAARVEGESSGGKVSALEAQLRELQFVSERKLMSVAQEAEARQHHLELELQQERSVLQVRKCLFMFIGDGAYGTFDMAHH